LTPEPGEPDPACYLSGRLEFAFILSLASYFGSSGRFFWHATCNFLRMRLFAMMDFLIGLCYVAMIAMPAIVASVSFGHTHSGDL